MIIYYSQCNVRADRQFTGTLLAEEVNAVRWASGMFGKGACHHWQVMLATWCHLHTVDNDSRKNWFPLSMTVMFGGMMSHQ